eukprot:10112173-Lingulodinium_polyedra.AAC.1
MAASDVPPRQGESPRSDAVGDENAIPPGPESMADLMDYVRNMVARILAGPSRDRFIRNLRGKVMLRTKYSGMGSEAVALWWIGRAVEKAGVDLPDD